MSSTSTIRAGVTADFAVEDFAAVYPEAASLVQRHWQEIAPYRDGLCELNPDVDTYAAIAHKVTLITARVAGTLVGYIVFIVTPHLHYRDVLTATDDIHFLLPEYRNSGIGRRLFVFAEKVMREKGVRMMALRCKAAPEHNHGAIFERLGYDKQDIVYTKRLDR